MSERFVTSCGSIELNKVTIGQVVTSNLISRIIDKTKPEILARSLINKGFRTFDTADSYGLRNEFLRKSLAKIPRDKFEIISKVYFPYSRDSRKRGLSEFNIRSSFEYSTKKLNLEYLDILLAHRFDPEVRIDETARTMSELVSKGKIRAWGLSEWNSEQIEKLVKICDEGNYAKPILIQSQASLLWRSSLVNLRQICNKNGISIMAWSPLAQGVLTGKYEVDKTASKKSRKLQNPTPFLNYFLESEVVDLLSSYKKEKNLSSEEMAQIAIGWLFLNGVDSVVTNNHRGLAKKPYSSSEYITELEQLLSPHAIADPSYIGKDSP